MPQPQRNIAPRISDASGDAGWPDAVLECRRRLVALEEVKDDVLVLLGGAPGIDDSTRALWVGDLRSAYVCAANATARLASVAGPNDEHAIAARNALLEARIRAAQVESELRAMDGESATELHRRWTTAFVACDAAIRTALRRVLVAKPAQREPERVLPLDDGRVLLPCSVCGGIAAEFWVGRERVTQREGLVYTGIVQAWVAPHVLAPSLLESVRAGRIG